MTPDSTPADGAGPRLHQEPCALRPHEMVSSREPRLRVGDGSPLLAMHLSQVGTSFSWSRWVITGLITTSSWGTFLGAGSMTDSKAVTQHIGSHCPLGSSSIPPAGRGGRHVVAKTAETLLFFWLGCTGLGPRQGLWASFISSWGLLLGNRDKMGTAQQAAGQGGNCYR